MVLRRRRDEPAPTDWRALLALPHDSTRIPPNGDATRFDLTLDALLVAISDGIQTWKALGLSLEQRAAIGQVLLHSVDTFGSAEKAERWLRRSNVLLGAPPLGVIVDRPGDVDAELTRIDHGVYA